jgi:uncharacterized protein with NRDE domain
VSTSGRLANVTNFREPDCDVPDARSRGTLVVQFLDSDRGSRSYGTEAAANKGYNGFNLLLWDGEDLVFTSNRASGARVLQAGIYAFSNGGWTSRWPKVVGAQRRLEWLIREGRTENDDLLTLLMDRRQARDDELPSTGVGIEWERMLSAPFIDTPDFGTRCSTIVRCASDTGAFVIDEYTYEPGGSSTHLTMTA